MKRNDSKGKSRWKVEYLDSTVVKEFREFSAEIRARMTRIVGLIEEFGLENMKGNHVAHLRDKVWEVKARDRDGWGRSLFCTMKNKRIVILRCFMKKTNKTPRREIELALSRMKKLKY